MAVRVLMIGLDPALIDYGDPAFGGFQGLTEEKLRAAMTGDLDDLRGHGYDAELCLIDFGETAERVVRERIAARPADCVVMGAEVRLVAKNTTLFEAIVNLVHAESPAARFSFSDGPQTSVDAVRRQFPDAAG